VIINTRNLGKLRRVLTRIKEARRFVRDVEDEPELVASTLASLNQLEKDITLWIQNHLKVASGGPVL